METEQIVARDDYLSRATGTVARTVSSRSCVAPDVGVVVGVNSPIILWSKSNPEVTREPYLQS